MPPSFGCVRWLSAAVLIVALAGCSQPDATVEVRVCGDVEVPRQVDSIRVSLLDADRQTREQGVVELLKCPAGRVVGLPVALSLSPIEGAGFLQVQGLKEGEVVAESERTVELSQDADQFVQLPLTRACVGVVSCPLGQTCLQGSCRVAPPADEELRCTSDETGGTMPDAGTMDSNGDAGLPGDTGPAEPRSLCPNDAGASSDAADGSFQKGNGTRG